MKRILTSHLTLLIVAVIAIFGINIYHDISNQETGELAPLVQGWFYMLVLGLWIRKDAAKRNVGFPVDLALLMGYLIPIYLLHSRGWKGCGILAIICAVFVGLVVLAAAILFKL